MIHKRHHVVYIEMYGRSEQNELIHVFNFELPAADDQELSYMLKEGLFFVTNPSPLGKEFTKFHIIYADKDTPSVHMAEITVKTYTLNDFTWYKTVNKQ